MRTYTIEMEDDCKGRSIEVIIEDDALELPDDLRTLELITDGQMYLERDPIIVFSSLLIATPGKRNAKISGKIRSSGVYNLRSLIAMVCSEGCASSIIIVR